MSGTHDSPERQTDVTVTQTAPGRRTPAAPALTTPAPATPTPATPTPVTPAPSAPAPSKLSVRACRTCHTLFEAPRPGRSRPAVDRRAAGDDRYCSKACRRDGHRRGQSVACTPAVGYR